MVSPAKFSQTIILSLAGSLKLWGRNPRWLLYSPGVCHSYTPHPEPYSPQITALQSPNECH